MGGGGEAQKCVHFQGDREKQVLWGPRVQLEPGSAICLLWALK